MEIQTSDEKKKLSLTQKCPKTEPWHPKFWKNLRNFKINSNVAMQLLKSSFCEKRFLKCNFYRAVQFWRKTRCKVNFIVTLYMNLIEKWIIPFWIWDPY